VHTYHSDVDDDDNIKEEKYDDGVDDNADCDHCYHNDDYDDDNDDDDNDDDNDDDDNDDDDNAAYVPL